MSRHRNAEQNRITNSANKFFEKVAKFKYLRIIVTNQNYVHLETKIRLNMRNSYYRSVHNILSSHLQSENLKIKIQKPITLSALWV